MYVVQATGNLLGGFNTRNGSTGAANADTLPTGVLYVNGAASGNAVTVTNLSTGAYSFSVPLAGVAVGAVVWVVLTATVGAITDKMTSPATTTSAFAASDLTTARLANLDAAVSSVAGSVWGASVASYTTGGTFGGFLQSRLDVAVSTRLASTAGITPADVWTYTSRTLTTLNGLTPNSAFFTNAPSGGTGGTVVVTIAAAGVLPLGAAPGQGALPDLVRGDDYAVQIDLPESVAGVTGLWLAIKRGNTLDVDSVLFIAAGSSPSILNGAATLAAGTFTVDDAANGLVTLALPAETTRLLAPGQLTFSVKKALSGTARRTLAYGSVNVVGPFIDRLA